MIEELRRYRDDGSGGFEAGVDSLAASQASLSLTDGRASFVLPDGAPLLELSPTPRDYFVVVEMASDASSQALGSFRVTLEGSSSRLEDVTADSPLALLLPEAVSTQTMTVGSPCYALTRSHVCFGTTPVASPLASVSCSEGEYLEGETILLSGNPDDGFEVEEWSGTDDDGSITGSNQLTMPGMAHSVTVTYGLEDDRFVLGGTLSGTETLDAEQTITAGDGTEVVTGADVTFRAPDQVELRDAFSVASGASFTVVLEAPPDPCL